MQINGILGYSHVFCDQYDAVLQVKDGFLLENCNDLLITVRCGNIGVGRYLLLGFQQSRKHQFLDIIRICFYPIGGRSWHFGQVIQQRSQRGIHMEIDAQQPNDPFIFAVNGNGGGAQGRTAGRSVFIDNSLCIRRVCFDGIQHLQRKVGQRRAFAASGVVSIDNLYRRIIEVFQTVQNDLIARTNKSASPSSINR